MDEIFERAGKLFDKNQYKRDKKQPKPIEMNPAIDNQELEDVYKDKPVRRPRAKLIWQVRAENKLRGSHSII